MRPRKQRMLLIGLVLVGVVVSAGFALKAFQQNISYFFSPTQVVDGEAPGHHIFRIGGMVADGSVQRDPGSLTIHFLVTDYAHSVPVQYTGVLPDLFKEGSGVVARGRLDAAGHFIADKVLAKHDANYMPPSVAEAVKKGRAEAEASGKDVVLPPAPRGGSAMGAGEPLTFNSPAPAPAAAGTALASGGPVEAQR